MSRPSAAGRRPNLFIVGAPKSATTSLYEYLREHPEVFMSPIKEPMYFSPDVYRHARQRYHYGQNEDEYLALFADARDEKRVGEASTHYLASPRAPQLIRDFDPGAKMVAILRNPVDVAYAWHDQRVHGGVEEVKEFDAIWTDPQRRDMYLSIGRYGSQLTRWLDAFPRPQLHVIVFDDLAADTDAEFGRLLRFLEVDDRFRPTHFAEHNTARSKSRIVPLLRRRPGRMAAELVKRVAGQRLARQLGASIRKNRLLQRGEDRTPLTPELRREMQAAFADEVAQAGRLLERDLHGLWFTAS